ncbi:MAG: O-antigen ligase family protein [Candidatus Doudnabacteria bacterium]|nr:O-antigen ligase family protein [Candidatus Doudnabacteria bacterium]
MNKFIAQFTTERVIWLLVLWQLISVLLMALGVWPQSMAWLTFGLLSVVILFIRPFDGLLLFIISMPFYVVLPNPYFDSLSMWRPLAVVLFVSWVMRLYVVHHQYFLKVFMVRKYKEPFKLKTITNFIKVVDSNFMWWDKYLAAFIVIALISTFFARFPEESIKQIIFLLNAYLLYIVVINSVTDRLQVKKLLHYLAASTGIIVALGFVQLIATFFTSQYYFWQYWAIMISSLYYGTGLADILAYSNSWFSYTGSTPTLRMFSIMPDSHSFGMVAVLLATFLIPLTFIYYKPGISWRNPKALFGSKNYFLWNVIRLSGLAVIFSGTRGLWVGMLVPFVISIALYVKNISRPVFRKAIFAYLLVILFFVLSPFINQGLNYVRQAGLEEKFLDRAASIYDLQESSNVGRLIIWQDSLIYGIHHPLGVGYGNFIVSLVSDIPEGTSFEQAGEGKNLRYNLPQKFVTAHSLYLNILVELGIFGLLAFGLFCLEFFRRVWKFVLKSKDEKMVYNSFVIVFALTFLWFMAYGVFDVTIFNDKVLLYVLSALGLSGIIMKRYEMFRQEELVKGHHHG